MDTTVNPSSTQRDLQAAAARGSLVELPALTGLRFCAAFFVLVGHANPALFKLSPEPWWLPRPILDAVTPLGMSLFFVLSGFVIHYNYADLLASPTSRNLAKFLIARFARLYPLYLLIVIADVGLGWKAIDFPAFYYYLTMTQSWIFGLFEGRTLIGHLRFSAVTWSISTEWFFYCSYPFLLWALGSSSGNGLQIRRFSILAAVFMILAATIQAFGYPIELLAGSVWGPTVVDYPAGNNRFLLWLTNYSPLGRMHEFLVGVVAAQLYMRWRDRPVERSERWLGTLALCAAFLVLAVTYGCVQIVDLSTVFGVVGKITVPLSIATILLCCARYRSLLARALSARWITACGDASYSIYLFHIVVIQSVAIPVMLSATTEMQLYVAVRFTISALLIILVSRGMYRTFEAPLRVALRSAYARHDSQPVSALIVALLIGVPVLFTAYGWIWSFSHLPQ